MTETENKDLFDLTGKRVYLAGHAGMVGAALVRRLRSVRIPTKRSRPHRGDWP